jgi:hypothetical protein
MEWGAEREGECSAAETDAVVRKGVFGMAMLWGGMESREGWLFAKEWSGVQWEGRRVDGSAALRCGMEWSGVGYGEGGGECLPVEW